MHASLKPIGRVATIVFALGLGAAALATPVSAESRGSVGLWPHGGGVGSFSHGGGNFRGRGGGSWGPDVGAAVVGGLIGGAIIGSAGYPYYDNGYGYAPDSCAPQYRDVYSSAGEYLGRQLVNTCQ
jgi:hypothetical protein